MLNKVRVVVNGYGVIGKRIADAVAVQDDMELIGVADVVSDWRIKVAVERGIAVYASTPQAADEMRAAGIPLTGLLEDVLQQVDVIADATPKKVASANFEKYNAAGVNSIFQGGEKHSLTGHSFVAQANYETALGRDSTRVVSCNTTSIVRTLGALKNAGLLKKARGVLIRRATDPWESDHGGVMNTVVPETVIPSHQGPDAQTVIPDLDVMKFCGLSCCPADSSRDILAIADYISPVKGGEGCVRDVLEKLMRVQGKWEHSVDVSST